MEQQVKKIIGLIDSTMRGGWSSHFVGGYEKDGQTSPMAGGGWGWGRIGNLVGSETLQGNCGLVVSSLIPRKPETTWVTI